MLFLQISSFIHPVPYRIKEFTSNGQPMEISALSVNPSRPSTPHSSNFVAVAFWGSNKVTILKLPALEPIAEDAFPNEGHLPRSILLHSFEGGAPHFLVGLADGGLVAYTLDEKTFLPVDRKLFSLGTTPVVLTLCKHSNGEKSAVFACSNRPAIFFHANGRLQQSPLLLKV